MSHLYWYKKDHEINAVVLIDLIKLSDLKSKFESLKVVYNIETLRMDTVEIYMNEVLLSEDEDKLSSIINEYSLSHPLEVRQNLENTLINPAMSYGREIVAKMGTNNVYQNKTDEQIAAISLQFNEMIIDLLTGSLKQAYYKCLSLEPNENISQDEIEEFTKRIGWFLGL